MKKETKQGYSFLMGMEKTLFRLIIIAGPLLLMVLPEEWMNLTLSGAIVFAMNFAKNYSFNEKNSVTK